MKHIAVLMGGPSAEREVSLSSGKAVIAALTSRGYQVTAIDVAEDLSQQLCAIKPDVVFNALHGRWGEDGCVQGLLELLKIPYTHSGVLASALAMDKPMAKRLFAESGLQVPQGGIYSKAALLAGDPLPRPYVVKPLNEGSSVGVYILTEDSNLFFTEDNWPFGKQVLVEPYIAGREIQVAVLSGKALGAIEICPKGQFYDYEAKYTDGKAEHLMPAPIPAEDYEIVCRLAERAHQTLGCRGLTRSDFRYAKDASGQDAFYLLEVNTQPGMTPLSLAPEIAAHAGIDFSSLLEKLIEEAALDSGL
jgi:D-alanine-D-alanine ligase